MLLNVPKLREVLEERTNWFKYGAEENEESKAKGKFYNTLLHSTMPRFVEELIANLKDAVISAEVDNQEDAFILENLVELIGRVSAGEFDLFEEKDD